MPTVIQCLVVDGEQKGVRGGKCGKPTSNSLHSQLPAVVCHDKTSGGTNKLEVTQCFMVNMSNATTVCFIKEINYQIRFHHFIKVKQHCFALIKC